MSRIVRQMLRQGVAVQRMPFRYYNTSGKPPSSTQTTPSATASTTSETASAATKAFTKDVLDNLVRTNKVVIFMKGNPEAPRCGFSNAVVQILRMHGVKYDAHDVLQNDELRQGIKDYSDWPTIPQIFINGEFVGGCDILLQMHQNGDLIEELKKAGIESQLLKDALAAEQQQKDDKTGKKK